MDFALHIVHSEVPYLSNILGQAQFRYRSIAPDKRGIHKVVFLFLHKNVCCGYSLEAPQ